jgi:tetratricopeptide repeat protein 30
MFPQQSRIPEGQKTKMIYGYIKDQRYDEAIRVLNQELNFCPKSRVMSLLGYCYYMAQDYLNASKVYEDLTYLYPNIDEYKLYYGQCLYKTGQYEDALKVSGAIQSKDYQKELILLYAYIRYEMDELQHAKTLCQSFESESSFVTLEAAILLKEGRFEESRTKFDYSKGISGPSCELLYNLALCHYRLKQYDKCMQYIAEIIEKGTREHPELGVGTNSEQMPVASVGNTQALKESALIEAFNLKAAIEYNLKNYQAAKEALWDMPPRNEDEFDPVTLMNYALMNMETDPSGGFKKLNFLLHSPPFPPESFANLLLLYAKYQYFDLAADVLAENSDLTFKYISEEDYEYIEALIFQNSNPDETVNKFVELGGRHVENLRRVTRQIKDAQVERDNDALKKALKEYDDC